MFTVRLCSSDNCVKDNIVYETTKNIGHCDM